MLATILKFSSFGAEQIFIFLIRFLFLWEGAESSHINVHRRILNVLYIYIVMPGIKTKKQL